MSFSYQNNPSGIAVSTTLRKRAFVHADARHGENNNVVTTGASGMLTIATPEAESQTQFTARYLNYAQGRISYELLRTSDPKRARLFLETVPLELQGSTSEMLLDCLALISRWVEQLGSWEAFRTFAKEALKDLKLRLIKEWSPQALQYLLGQHQQRNGVARRHTTPRDGGGGGGRASGGQTPCHFFNSAKGCRMGSKCFGKHVCSKCLKGGHGREDCHKGGK